MSGEAVANGRSEKPPAALPDTEQDGAVVGWSQITMETAHADGCHVSRDPFWQTNCPICSGASA